MKKAVRQNKNAKVLFISEDEQIKEGFKDKFRELIILNDKLFSNTIDLENCDIIVLDFDQNTIFLDNIIELIQKKLAFVPIIVVSKSDSQDSIEKAINLKAYTYILKSCPVSSILISVLMCLNQTQRSDKFKLDEGIYFDRYKDQFFDKSNNMIEFTRLEKGFLKLLISRLDEVTDYDLVQKEVWKGKKMSIFTMRNIVNKIRLKTYYSIIKNHSGRGYTIDLTHYSK